MENLQIKIVLTDGEKEAKTSINIEDYQMMKELHGVSLIDEQVDVLLNEITMKKKQTAVEWYANASHELIVKKNNGEITNVDFLILHHNLFYEAQKMEKEQIETAWYDGISGGQCGTSEQYYNETYREEYDNI